MEALASDASELVWKLMSEQNLSKADLARRLGKSRAWVTQLLSGSANVTVRTLAEVVHALGAQVKLQSYPAAGAGRAKPAASVWQPVIYRMGKQVLASPGASESTFHLAVESSNPYLNSDWDGEEEPLRPEYAA